MKNTFSLPRKNVNGFFPYIITTEDNTELYLFEVTKNSSYKWILKIEEAFKNDDQLIFATINKKLVDSSIAIDAMNAFKIARRKIRKFYFYSDGEFYKIETASLYKGCHLYKSLSISTETVSLTHDRKLNPTEIAIVLKIGDRFFSTYKNKRVNTAWSLAGAATFLPGNSNTTKIDYIENVLVKKKIKFERQIVSII